MSRVELLGVPEEILRSIAIASARFGLAAFLIAGLVNLPLMAAARPIGSVVIADKANLSGSSASAGANVFPGDYVDTGANGSLRLQITAGQMYLLASSSVVFAQEDQRLVAGLQRGTVGFSTTNPVAVAIQTPLGLVRSEDTKRVFGQVTILAPGKIQVTAYEGSLIVDGSDGRRQVIGAGETYNATLLSGGGGGTPVSAGGNGIRWDRVVAIALFVGAAFVAACSLWPESNSSPGCW